MNRIFPPISRLWTGLSLIALVFAVGISLHVSLLLRGDRKVLAEFIEHRSVAATEAMSFVTGIFSPLGTICLALLVGVFLWWVTKSWRVGAFIWCSVALSALVTYLLKMLFERSRPPIMDQLIFEPDFSFPSGHATGVSSLAFATALVMCALLRKPLAKVLTWVVAAMLVVLIVVSRLYLGVHWFTDTFAGCLVGVGTGLVLSYFLPELTPGVETESGSKAAHPEKASEAKSVKIWEWNR